MRKMKRIGTILGILLTIMILISGSVVATWHYVTVINSIYCTHILEIEDGPDEEYATLGQNPYTLGTVRLSLGAYPMQADQVFTVFADPFGATEYYEVFVGEDLDELISVGSNDDQGDHDFYTPNWGSSWRYIILVGTEGAIGDSVWGPEIDAVGWESS